MFNYHPITSVFFKGILAASVGYDQNAYSAEVQSPLRESSELHVTVLDSSQRSMILSTTIRINNVTNHELIFSTGSKDPALVSLHMVGQVIPGKISIENVSTESNWPAEITLDDQTHLSPEESLTIQVRFRLRDLQESRSGSPFIELNGSLGDHSKATQVPISPAIWSRARETLGTKDMHGATSIGKRPPRAWARGGNRVS